jgi:hypothetical protein
MKTMKIQAKAAVEQGDLVRGGYATVLTEGTGTRREIQWMPPGKRTIEAYVNGKPKEVEINATAATAALVARKITKMLAAADAGDDVRPYIDFNHEDKEASGWPVSAHWGGDDPKAGGVRLVVELSEAGTEAITGRKFQAFSPEFLARDGEVVDVSLNLGGLVNRPAFRAIERFFAKDGGGAGGAAPTNKTAATEKNEDKEMNKTLMKILARLGLLSSSEVSDDAAVAELSGKEPEVKAALEYHAKRGEHVAKADHDAVKAQLSGLRKTNAEAVVAKAVAEGRLAPKDDTVKAKWQKRLEEHPEDADLLESLPAAKPPEKQVIQGGKPPESTGGEKDHEFLVKAKAYRLENKCSDEVAAEAVAASNPGLYEAYTKEILAKGGKN